MSMTRTKAAVNLGNKQNPYSQNELIWFLFLFFGFFFDKTICRWNGQKTVFTPHQNPLHKKSILKHAKKKLCRLRIARKNNNNNNRKKQKQNDSPSSHKINHIHNVINECVLDSFVWFQIKNGWLDTRFSCLAPLDATLNVHIFFVFFFGIRKKKKTASAINCANSDELEPIDTLIKHISHTAPCGK